MSIDLAQILCELIAIAIFTYKIRMNDIKHHYKKNLQHWLTVHTLVVHDNEPLIFTT